NNQPFFTADRVTRGLTVRSRQRADFEYLITCLEAANQLTPTECLRAFAAFLRGRLLTAAAPTLQLEERTYDLEKLRAKLRTFITGGGEGGRRGEAVTAAALDLIYPNVHINVKANDPSRHWPGDVTALANRRTIKTKNPDDVLLPTEVKERMASEGEVL